MVSPADFIPIAEMTGLILPVGEWVIKEAFKQLANTCVIIDSPPNSSKSLFGNLDDSSLPGMAIIKFLFKLVIKSR